MSTQLFGAMSAEGIEVRTNRATKTNLPVDVKNRTRAVIDLCAYAVVLPLMIWLSSALFNHLAAGYLRNERSGQSAMNLPVWPFRVVFLVAFTLLALQLLAEVVKAARLLRSRG